MTRRAPDPSELDRFQAKLLRRLAQDYPRFYIAFRRGEFRSVFAALRAAERAKPDHCWSRYRILPPRRT